MTAPTPNPDNAPAREPDPLRPPLKLVRLKDESATPDPLHDTANENRPLALPVPVARGVHTANWFLHEGEHAVVLIAVNSRGVVEEFREVSTERDAQDGERELYRLLDLVDPVRPATLRLEGEG